MVMVLQAIRWLLAGVMALFLLLAIATGGVVAMVLLALALLAFLPPAGKVVGSFMPAFNGNATPYAVGFALFIAGAIAISVSPGPKASTHAGGMASNAPIAPASTVATEQPAPTAVPVQAASLPLKPVDEAGAAKIDPGALALIKGKGWDKTRKAWGPDWVARINAALPKAAKKVSLAPDCDYVEQVALSESRSTPRSQMTFYADCRNRKRFYVTEKDLESERVITSVQSQMMRVDEADAYEACRDRIKAQLKYPSSLDRNFFGTSVYQAPTGNLVVDFTFEAKNGLGAKLPHRARCVINDLGVASAEISPA